MNDDDIDDICLKLVCVCSYFLLNDVFLIPWKMRCFEPCARVRLDTSALDRQAGFGEA